MQLILVVQILLFGLFSPAISAEAETFKNGESFKEGKNSLGRDHVEIILDNRFLPRNLTGSNADCPRGTKKTGGVCKCILECPLGSKVKKSLKCPLNLSRHCLCKQGYHVQRMKCVKNYRFNPVLPSFGPSVATPYKSCKDLRRGIWKALQLLADSILDRELNSRCSHQKDFEELPPVQADADGGGGEDSFETNNQVEGVDEADVVKSDGTYIFATYGTELVMMNLNGDVTARVTCLKLDAKNPLPVRALLLDRFAQTVTALGSDYGTQTSASIYSYRRGTLDLRGVVDIPGTYNDARSIGSKAHIITNVHIRTYHLNTALSRCNEEYRDLSDEQYEKLAFQRAKTAIIKLLPTVLQQMGDVRKGQCRNIAQISTMTTADSDSTETEEDSTLDWRGGAGLLQNFVCITSFDMSNRIKGYEGPATRTAGAFIPSSNTEVFASREVIVVAGRGYRRINQGAATNVWVQQTHLIGFQFESNNSRVSPAAVGSVRGYLLNQFSMDFYDGFFRVATTNLQRWGYIDGRWQVVAESSSQVAKLKFVSGKINIVGQLSGLGTTERIFSVRFVGNRGYVVTFRQIDPLFVIDMDPEVPVVLGELKIPGFSNFLQQIGENNEYLLGIGQEADEETGRRSGLKISLFDVRNSANPQEVQSHVVGGFSSSAAQFESKAFRYLPISKKLIIPVRVYSSGKEEDFDGFVVFDVDVIRGINPVGKVTHADNDRINQSRFCYSPSLLEPRSLVFNGNLVTLKGHSVKYSNGLEALQEGWTVNLDKDRDSSKDDCYKYFLS